MGVVGRVVENHVEVSATPAAVWVRVVDVDGINHEMRPWMTMNMPRGTSGLTVETIPLGRPVGRAWLRLFGLIPFDYDHLTIVELEPGKRFLERSTMLSMRHWEHERTLIPVPGGTRVRDRVILEPRLPIPGLAAILATLLDAFFKHRQRRLRALHLRGRQLRRPSGAVRLNWQGSPKGPPIHRPWRKRDPRQPGRPAGGGMTHSARQKRACATGRARRARTHRWSVSHPRAKLDGHAPIAYPVATEECTLMAAETCGGSPGHTRRSVAPRLMRSSR